MRKGWRIIDEEVISHPTPVMRLILCGFIFFSVSIGYTITHISHLPS